MTLTTDFEELNEEKAVAELAIKIRADLEYTLRVLDEQIATIDESTKDENHAIISETVREEEANVLKKVKALQDDLQMNHTEYLTIAGERKR